MPEFIMRLRDERTDARIVPYGFNLPKTTTAFGSFHFYQYKNKVIIQGLHRSFLSERSTFGSFLELSLLSDHIFQKNAKIFSYPV